ncbi:NAD(P)/FAD-dependent oxidoreductase [Pseudomaricurvus alcaniphilus]|uniref:NAD(P)/FAD-dependent oxidoreductase n=1 Tax=Pseudomaricurvus alcaniphilus TaxID=1166482 RepID=UPI00140E43A3|nr:FAD/NAD(P)-binding oxidoreductase [Pseudomaricurvus alcaniphilus]NHN37855.1 NAD(P)/FAD-dependent oxidoreductase [Pseudomaricurvus alcaniphilus]
MAAAAVEPRVVVVGAGPAGSRCVEALVKAGIRPLVIDESARSGGQIYRRQPDNFTRSAEQLYGSEAAKATRLHKSFDGLQGRFDYWPESLIWNLAGNRIFVVRGAQQCSVEFSSLVICSGATDRLLPVPGWNYSGCYSLGGAQIALKAQACAIGAEVVFMGTGPLLYLVAAQYAKAGARVAGVLDTSPFYRRVAALPDLLANPRALYHGLGLTASLYLKGVPVYSGVEPLAIEGDAAAGVSAVRFRDGRGREKQLHCDAVAMGYHLRPETQLADLARCQFDFDASTRQWLPRIDRDGRSTVADIYLAGDGARIRGADAAEASGELAALALLADRGQAVDSQRVARLQQQLGQLERFARGLAKAFPWPHQLAAQLADATVLCRCEVVTVGEMRSTIALTGASEANRAKAFSRVGMGRCQGRYCANAGAEVIAAATDGDICSAGRLRAQAPVKPLPLALVEVAPEDWLEVSAEGVDPVLKPAEAGL